MRRFDLRLRKLEVQVYEVAQQERTHVVWIGPDGYPEAWPVMGPRETVIALPRKAASAEEWQEWCALLLADRQDWEVYQCARGHHWLREGEDA